MVRQPPPGCGKALLPQNQFQARVTADVRVRRSGRLEPGLACSHTAPLEFMCVVRTERLNLVTMCLQQFPDANPVTSGHLEPRRHYELQKLAAHRNPHCAKSEAQIAKALDGNYKRNRREARNLASQPASSRSPADIAYPALLFSAEASTSASSSSLGGLGNHSNSPRARKSSISLSRG
jgi:hypothetical protein